MKELTRAEKALGIVLAAILGLGAVAAAAMPMLSSEHDCGIWCWCRAEAGKKYLVCGARE